MKISVQEYVDFEKDYRTGRFLGQRMGQAFLNRHTQFHANPADVGCLINELWNTEDPRRVRAILWGHCIDAEVPEPHSCED